MSVARQMFGDGSPAEFTPIGEWVREHSVFNAMKQMPFFRTYMVLRMFRTWRGAARVQRFDKVSERGDRLVKNGVMRSML